MSKTKLKEIEGRIELCNQYNKRLLYYLNSLKKQYYRGNLTQDQYKAKLALKLGDKTLHEWIKYYHDYKFNLYKEKEKLTVNYPLRNVLLDLAILIVGITLLYQLTINSSFDTGFAIFDIFKEKSIIKLDQNITINSNLTIVINPTSSGVYREAYFVKDQQVITPILLCELIICYDKITINYQIPEAWLGTYSLQVFNYESNEYIAENFTVFKPQEIITFDRLVDCTRCSQNKAPPLAEINMSIIIKNNNVSNVTISDYYNNQWSILNPNNGVISLYNSTYNQISWTINNSSSQIIKSYTIKSPNGTQPPTDYIFYSQYNNILSEPWSIIVADPPKECSDGLDNDGDLAIDHPADAGCTNKNDNDETNCGDGVCEGGETSSSCPLDCVTTTTTTTTSTTTSTSTTTTTLAAISVELDPAFSIVDFSQLTLGELKNTQLNNPTPFLIRNIGTSAIDIEIYADISLWQILTSGAFGFRVNDPITIGDSCVNGVNDCFDEATSIMTPTNIPIGLANKILIIDNLKNQDATDEARLDIAVSVPTDEPPGTKTSTIYIIAVAA